MDDEQCFLDGWGDNVELSYRGANDFFRTVGEKIRRKLGEMNYIFLDFENFRGRKPPSIFLTNNDNEHRVITRATFSINNGIFQNEF